MDKACVRNKCQDPCPGTCGISAVCFVSNHIPICSCPEGLTGDAFQMCRPIPVKPERGNPQWYVYNYLSWFNNEFSTTDNFAYSLFSYYNKRHELMFEWFNRSVRPVCAIAMRTEYTLSSDEWCCDLRMFTGIWGIAVDEWMPTRMCH